MVTERLQDKNNTSRPESRRDRYERGLSSIRKEDRVSEIEEFDWFSKRPTSKPIPPDNLQVAGEKISDEERKSRMLHNLSRACRSCTMCDLGLKLVENNEIARDPHIFSNGSISKVMVVCKSPDWDSLSRGEPFNGSREKFDQELSKYSLSYHDFYFCSLLRCYTTDQNESNMNSCEPFLQMEINLLKPKLMIAVGELVFNRLCPGYIGPMDNLVTNKYGVKTFCLMNGSVHIKKMAMLASKIFNRST